MARLGVVSIWQCERCSAHYLGGCRAIASYASTCPRALACKPLHLGRWRLLPISLTILPTSACRHSATHNYVGFFGLNFSKPSRGRRGDRAANVIPSLCSWPPSRLGGRQGCGGFFVGMNRCCILPAQNQNKDLEHLVLCFGEAQVLRRRQRLGLSRASGPNFSLQAVLHGNVGGGGRKRHSPFVICVRWRRGEPWRIERGGCW